MNWGLLAVGGLFVIAYGAVAVAALRSPFLARLAARQAVRRRWQSALLITGLMVGGTAITASMVAADSEGDSAAVNAQRTWGRVDLTIDAGGRFFSPALAAQLDDQLRKQSSVRGVQPGIEWVGSASDLDRQIGKPTVRLIGFDPASQPAFGAYVLQDGRQTFGEDLAPGQVLLSQQLADAISARAGDRLQFSVAQAHEVHATDLTVAGIARSEGPGSYGLQLAIFAPLVTTDRITGSGFINMVRISAAGDGQAELDAASRAAPIVRSAVRGLPSGMSLDVREVKASQIKATAQATETDRSALLVLSLLVVVAAAALVVNLAVALAEERRPQLGIMRALGLSRAGVVAASVIEAALYSLAASLLAVIPGIAAGQLVAVRLRDAYLASPGSPADYVFHLSVRPDTLAVSIVSGALITLATMVVGAVRTSRMSIAAAVRDLPEPGRQVRRIWPRLALLPVLTIAVPALVLGDATGRLLGGIGLIVVASSVACYRLPRRMRAILVGAALAGWAFVIGGTLNYSGDASRFALPFFLSLMTAVLGLSILSMANLPLVEVVGRLVPGRSKRVRAVLRVPLSYLAQRPVRTGLATGAIAVVLSLVAFMAVAFGSLKPDYRRDSAGYDIRLTSSGEQSITLPPALLGQVARQVSIPTRAYIGPLRTSVLFYPGSEAIPFPLYEFSGDLMKHPAVHIEARYAGFDTDAAMWRAVETDPRWVVTAAGAPGDTIGLRGSRGLVSYRIAGLPQVGILDGVIGSAKALQPFDGVPLGDTVLLTTKSGVDSRAFAQQLQAALFAQGVDASPVQVLLQAGERDTRSRLWTQLIVLQIGLTIGVLSIGMLALREVVERRHALGVLRALGFRSREVTIAVISEALVTATMGVVGGCVAGTVLGYLFMRRFLPGSVGIDSSTLLSALILIFGAVIVVTIGPALRASRLPPAQALRFSE